MKRFRVLMAVLLVCVMAFAALPAFGEKEHAEAENTRGNTYTNQYINVVVGTDGRVNSYTTADGRRLLYGTISSGSTSYTTVAIGNSTYQFGGNLTVAPDFDGKTNYCAQTYNGVLVEQKLTIVPNDAGEESIVKWEYIYTNNSNTAQDVGCRIMLDTCLDDNDGAPFRLPNVDSIATESELNGDEIQRVWFTYDQDITAQGSFDEDKMPDKLQFASWRRTEWLFFSYGLYVTEWEYETNFGYAFDDAAVAATWYQEALQPGESREYVAYYGLGNIPIIVEGSLTFAINGDHGCELNETMDGYTPSPAYLWTAMGNAGNGNVTGAYEYVVLPEGLSFAEGSESYYEVGTIAPGGEVTHTWNFVVDETSEEDRVFYIYVYYGCDGNEEAYVVWQYFVPGVPAVETVPPVIATENAELRTRNTADAFKDLRFIFRVTFNDSFVDYKGTVYGPAEAYEITRFYSELTVGDETTVTVEGVNIYEMYEDAEDPYFLFTAVVKGIRPVNFDSDITAYGYLEYIKTATEELGTDNTLDEEFVYCVNDLIN